MRPLTPREEQVLMLISGGHSRESAALTLGLSQRTVRFHCDNVRNKLQAATMAHAVTRYLQGYIRTLEAKCEAYEGRA